MKRREFIKNTVVSAAFLGASGLKAEEVEESVITVLHTNDTHSRLDPFPKGSGYRSGMGGVSRRASLVNLLRKKYKNVLLLDAGDVFQGTPYFNFYEGRLEYETMSMIGYDFGTLGNHDFDLGVEKLLKAMDFLNFKLINSNYKTDISKFKKHVLENTVLEKGGIKIGIFGLGVSFKGLVSDEAHKGIIELDKIETAKKQIKYLKSKGVDYIILLSHLGVDGDKKLAGEVKGIDLIVGGHSHTKIDKPLVVGKTLILQAASSGIYLGKLDLNFKNKTLYSYDYELIPVKEETEI